MSTSLETKQFPIQNTGIDWLSIRSKEFDVCAAYSALAFDVFKAAKESGEKVEQAVRVGFGGRAVAGLFLGHREDTSLLTLSSDVARRYGPVALRLGGSVARIDLQVTIDTGPDKFNLASTSYYRAKTMPLSGGRPRELKLTMTHPQGDTLNVNKRSSDHYGRIYDWGAAHSQGEKHRYWRYEVEFKRSMAKSISATLLEYPSVEGVASSLVHAWYKSRIPFVSFAPDPASCTHDLLKDTKPRDVLAWFESSLSVCVARAIKDYGEARTLKALGLERYLNLKAKEVVHNAR